jgi:hypothetical protein
VAAAAERVEVRSPAARVVLAAMVALGFGGGDDVESLRQT